jgi:hypothetical protein
VARIRTLCLLATVVMVACSREPTAVSDGVLSVSRAPGALRLGNTSAGSVNYFVIERSSAALIDWVPCAGPSCPAVPPAGSVSVPHSQIAGYSAGAREVIVYWWRSVADGAGGFRPDSLRNLVAPL